MQNNDSRKKNQLPLLLFFLLAILLSLVCVSSATLLAVKAGSPSSIEASMLAQSEANYQSDQNQTLFGQLNPAIIIAATNDAASLVVTPPSNKVVGELVQNFAGTAVAQIFPTAQPTTLPTAVIVIIAPEIVETGVSIIANTPTASATQVQNNTPTPPFTSTATAQATTNSTPTATFVATIPIATPTATATTNIVVPPTNTPLPPAPTNTPNPAATATGTPLPTVTATNTAVATSTPTATSVSTFTPTPTATATLIPPSNEILFVVGDKTAPTGVDLVTALAFMNKGFILTTLNDSETNPADSVGKALVYISASIDPALLGNRLRDVPVPIIVAESYLFADMGLTGPIEDSDYGTIKGSHQDSIDIFNPTHPLAAGLSGTVQVYITADHLNWGVPAPSAITIARSVDGNDRKVLFAYESGSNMVGVVAPARRVAFFHSAEGAAFLTPDGSALFDAAVAWVIGP